MITKKEKIALAFAVLHLGIVILAAAQIEMAAIPLIGRSLHYYGALSGAGNSYGFFAPGVGSSFRAEFDVEEHNHSHTDHLERHHNRESDLRFGNLLGLLSRNVDDEKARRAIAASWAGKIFARYPEASAVTVRLEMHGVPVMKLYKEGIRASWEPFYRAKFVKSKVAHNTLTSADEPTPFIP